MGIRNMTGRTLKSVIGNERTTQVRNAEKRLRRKAAVRLDPTLSQSRAKRRFSISGGTNAYVPGAPFTEHIKPTVTRHELLSGIHKVSHPATYLEIGIATGKSLALSRTRSIGIDPQFSIEQELECDVQLHRTPSDKYFARPDACSFFEGVPLELAFIDGMHLSEYALRDFMNVEKHMSPAGVVVMDDMLPRNDLEAARERRTRGWAGDVFKVANILLKFRPDLTVIPVNTHPTGTVIVLGLDPESRVLEDNYDEALAICTTADPQHVDPKWLHRSTAVDPTVLLASPAWADLVALRDKDVDRATLSRVLSALPQVTAP